MFQKITLREVSNFCAECHSIFFLGCKGGGESDGRSRVEHEERQLRKFGDSKLLGNILEFSFFKHVDSAEYKQLP